MLWLILSPFSSPEPKAQVSYCHRNFFVVSLKNHSANFNQTWQDTCVGMGIQICSYKGVWSLLGSNKG